MSRLIDADETLNLFGIGDDDLYAIHTIEDAIYNGSLRTIDAVPVVRCADCKYLDEDLAIGGWDGSCKYWNTHSVTYSWFCSQGEKKVTE